MIIIHSFSLSKKKVALLRPLQKCRIKGRIVRDRRRRRRESKAREGEEKKGGLIDHKGVRL